MLSASLHKHRPADMVVRGTNNPTAHSCLTAEHPTTYFFLRSFLLVSDTRLPCESRLKLRFLATVVM